jgi:4,4'-diapophytoene synthase
MNGVQSTADRTVAAQELTDDDLQAHMLDGVSRSFALTIPQLPNSLRHIVSNAYLLCRIVDTIEDEIALTPEQKRAFCHEFINVVKNSADAASFARRLAPLLSTQTIPEEHELIGSIPRVIEITRRATPEQQEALAACVETMAEGMPRFQKQDLRHGLDTMADMDEYCYYVAGCVGEMLTELFCHYSPDVAKNEDELINYAVSFGQGLQMTNILKDIWDDYDRGVCWLPREIFTEAGFDLSDLKPGQNSAQFREGLAELVSIAYRHLSDALRYTLMIPKEEIGIRNFCLWAIGMAVLTLKKINNNLDFSRSAQVKISRRSVKATILATRFAGRNNTLLTLLFRIAGRGLSQTKQQASQKRTTH